MADVLPGDDREKRCGAIPGGVPCDEEGEDGDPGEGGIVYARRGGNIACRDTACVTVARGMPWYVSREP